jgi:alanyl aminopeptidase
MPPLRPILLVASLTLLPCFAAAADEAPPNRLARTVVPTFQSIELHVDPRRPDYEGRVRIDLDVREITDRFRLHSEGSRLDSIALTVRGRAVPVERREVANGMWELRTPAPLERGSGVLEIAFTNEFDTKGSGLYRLESDGHHYTFSQFEATDAREAFPCFDEPEFKIPWQVTLVVPRTHLAITNTPVLRETAEGQAKRIVFERTPPMSSYLLAVCTGPFETVDIPGMKVPSRVVAPRGQIGLAGHARRVTPPLMRALERYFGRPYPYEKLDLIAVPEYWYGAMENPGAITFVDNGLLLPEDAGLAQQRRLASTVAHELAHMWFGNLVTMKWWDDLWLNESFASWLGDKITEQIYPEMQVQLHGMSGIDRAKRTDARASTRAMRKPVDVADNLDQLADALAYDKGQAVLTMFEQWLTPAVFRRGVLLYIRENAWKNAEAADLWRALGRASGRDVGAAMGTFLDQAGVPLLRVEPGEGAQVTLSQARFVNAGLESDDTRWRLPVTLRYSDGGAVRTISVMLDAPSQTITLPGVTIVDWIHPNAGEIGYYRWALPAPALDALATRGLPRLDAAERRGFVSNLSGLLDAGLVDGSTYLAMLPRLADDAEPVVIEGLLEELGRLRDVFWTPELDAPLAHYVRGTLRPVVERFRLEARPGESESVRLLRPELLQRLATDGRDPVALAQGEALADAYFEDPALVDPSAVAAALRVAAVRGDRDRLERYRERFATTRLPTERRALLGALAGFGDEALARESLAWALGGPLRAQEIGRLMFTMWRSPEHRDLLYEWVAARYADITARIPDIQQADLAILLGGCSRERIVALQEFFAAPEHRPIGIDTALRQTIARTSDCATLREREGAAVKTFLERSMAGVKTSAPAP